MSAEGGVAGIRPASGKAIRRRSALVASATAIVWLAGSAVVVVAQSGFDRRVSALAAAGAGIVCILGVALVTSDPARRYLRSIVAGIVAVSLTSDWMLWHLGVSSSGFQVTGLVERMALPLIIVLLLPLVAAAVWEQRATLVRATHEMDWIIAAYATVVLLPALALGLHNHNRLTFIGQDLGLILFIAFMYLAGRAVTAEAARASSAEIVELLLLLAAAKIIVFGWDIIPLYSYIEAACAAALAFLVLRPRSSRVLSVGIAVTLLAYDAVQVRHGSNSSTAVELAGAIAVLAYLVVRMRPAVPKWLVLAVALVAIAGFVGLTHDGAALRGQYHGPDPSNTGRTFEAHQVRSTVDGSALSRLLGRGLGGTIDETQAPLAFRQTLIYGGRDLAHVQEVHLVEYAFLLKAGFLGVAWLAVFAVGLAIVLVRGLERAARRRDPRVVLYVALPLLGVVQAFSASSRLQGDPLNGLALGILVTYLGPHSVSVASIRAQGRQILAAAAITLVGCGAVAYLSAHRSEAASSVALPTQPVALWIGDSYTAGAGATTSATGEALATSQALGWQTDMDAEGATGYVARGRKQSKKNKPLPARIPTDAASFSDVSVVLIDAGRNDVKHSQAKIHRAVVSTFNEVAKGFPSSAVVVIAPYLMTSNRHSFLAMRRLLRQQTRIRGWAYVDPIAEGWINRATAKLVVKDHIHPNQQGYNDIVAHLGPAIERALRAAHEHVSLHCTRAAPCRRRPHEPARAR